MSVRATVPILACSDLGAMIDFYVTRLGFVQEWTWGDPPTDGGVRRDEIQIFFMTNPEIAQRAEGNEVMVFVTGVDALHAEHTARGAPISSEIEDKEWGLREYTVRDPHGYLLRFAQGIAQARERG
jgi:catechol 2,3-dioxygenase-like lactoylglutathione lyase family enzyme